MLVLLTSTSTSTATYEPLHVTEDESDTVVFERYRDADAAIEHFSNISHLMKPIMATASVTAARARSSASGTP
jgi:quinol monooxygenase YgiN